MRSIPITEETYSALLEHKKWHQQEMLAKSYRTSQIFTTCKGNLYDPRSIRHTLDRIHGDAGVPKYGFHVYRHTFGTNLSRAGVPIERTSKLMGHSGVDVTSQYYINIGQEEKLDAVEKIVHFSLERKEA